MMERNRHKKFGAGILSLVLAAALMLAMVPQPVLAADEKPTLTITLPKYEIQQMDAIPSVTYEDFTYDGLMNGDDGPTLLREKNVRIIGLPTNSYNVKIASYSLGPEVQNLADYTVVVKQGSVFVADKTFTTQPFTVSPQPAYTDSQGVDWYAGPITLTATDPVFPYIKVAGGSWGDTATLTKEVSSSGNGELFGLSIDSLGSNCQVIYKAFNYRLDTTPPRLSSVWSTASTATTVTVSALASDNGSDGVGSKVKTVYFLCLPENDPAPTAETVVSANHTGTSNSSGMITATLENLLYNTRYRLYGVAQDNVGHCSDVVSDSFTLSTAKGSIAGDITLSNTSPKVGETIAAVEDITVPNAGTLHYQWYRSPGNVQLNGQTGSSYTVTAADINGQLYCKVGAANCTDELTSTMTDAVQKGNQSALSFNTYSTNTIYGDPAFSMAVSGGTGTGAVTYSSSDPTVASVDANGLVTIHKVGSFTVIANKSGNTAYNEASVTSDFITVQPKALTITGLTAADRTYDGSTQVALTGGQLTGIVSDDDVSLALPTTGKIADKNVGADKAVTVDFQPLTGEKASCYILTKPTAITVKITPMDVSITGVTVQDKTYDGTTMAQIKAAGSIQGKLNADDLSIVTGTCAFTDKTASRAQAVTAAGFSLTGTDAGNYRLTAQPEIRNAAINKAVLNIGVADVVLSKGDPMPTLTVHAAGFVNGESEALPGFVLPTASVDGTVDTNDTTIKSFAVSYAGGNSTENYSFAFINRASIDIRRAAVGDYAAVYAAIKKAQSLIAADYKDFSAVTAALNNVVYNLDISKQSVIDGYVNAIEKAIQGLEKKENAVASPKPEDTPSNLPQTGDTGHEALFVLLLLLSGGGLTALVVCTGRKKSIR